MFYQSEALRDALVEIDWSHPTASVCMSPDPPYFAIGVESSSGFAYEVKFPKDAPVFSEYNCTTTQNNCYNLSQLRTCLKALALSAGPAGSTSIRMNASDMLSLNHIINAEGNPMAFGACVCVCVSQRHEQRVAAHVVLLRATIDPRSVQYSRCYNANISLVARQWNSSCWRPPLAVAQMQVTWTDQGRS